MGKREGFDGASLVALKTKDGTVRQEMKAASRSWKRREMDSLLDPPEGMQPCATFQASSLQNFKIINLCCFKPLSLLQICYRTIGNKCRAHSTLFPYRVPGPQ